MRLTNKEYHARSELGSSQLKQVLRSPAHYWQANLAPNRPPNDPSPAMQFGTLVHAAILEPDTLSTIARVLPNDAPDKRSKDGKAWWADFERETGDRLIFTEERYAAALTISALIRADDVCAKLLSDCEFEISGFWRDRETGVQCKFRPDAIKKDRSIIIDVKTTRDASKDEFSRSIASFRYDLSAAHYIDGSLEAFDAMPHSFIFLAIETELPFAFALYRADVDVIAKGQHDRMRALRRVAECQSTGEWPSYEPGIWPISLPKWAQRYSTDA